VSLKRTRKPWQIEEDLRRLIQGKGEGVMMMAQFGAEAVVRKNVMLRGGRSESGVANWTGEHSTKTLREQATLKDWGQKSQAWG
jgi:hypothetical protein